MKQNNYTRKEIKQETEATCFACALLMPFEMFQEAMNERKFMQEEDRIKELSNLFQVPEWAVVIRMQMYNEIINQ